MAKKKVSKKKVSPKKPSPKAGEPSEKKAEDKVLRCLARVEKLGASAIERVASECRHNLTNDAHVRYYLRIEEEPLTHELVRMLMSKLTQVKAEDCR